VPSANRGCGCGSFLVAIAVLAAVTIAVNVVSVRIDRWRFPWGYADSGRPTLVGTWVGPATTPGGQRLAMLVEIDLIPLDRGRRHPPILRMSRRSGWLEGRALVCRAPGRVGRFTLRGRPDDESSASRFHLGAAPADSVPSDGLSPSNIKGQWAGGDSMNLSVSLYLRRGKSAISSTSDPDTGRPTSATLRRGAESDFNSLCARTLTSRR
jgi:hypothetical protein